MFSAAAFVLLSLLMVYGWQHFSAIEKGYTVEAEKQQVEALREENQRLQLAEEQLSQPKRIDAMARQMGMVDLQPNQVVRATDRMDAGAPAMAQVSQPAVVMAAVR